MSQITSLYVYKVVAQASSGVDVRDLFEALDLDPAGPIDPGLSWRTLRVSSVADAAASRSSESWE
ncbi:hypothetical protein [Congregibacter sp.]|uniref:hypothetical protein n=1 Tax=Congregibacter sp. TaxID=2744308 RepID=UPI003F6C15B3